MKLLRHWERFWFQPRETLTIGVLRALVGFLVVCYCALLAGSVPTWYMDSGLATTAASRLWNGPAYPSLLFIWHTPVDVWIFFALLSLSAITMMLGLYSRLSAIVCYILLLSFHHRDLQILKSGDTMMRLLVLYTALAPCGASFSLDALRRRSKDPSSYAILTDGEPSSLGSFRRLLNEIVYGPARRRMAPWAQRLIQFNISIVYIQTVSDKWPGPSWRNGTALWYVNHLSEMQRFGSPAFTHTPLFINIETWFTLVAELSMALLVWFPPTRLMALLFGAMLHLGIEYQMNVPLFSATMLTAYLAFLDLDELYRRFRLTTWGRSLRLPDRGDPVPSKARADATLNSRARPGSAPEANGATGKEGRRSTEVNGRSASRVRPHRKR